MKWGVLLLGAVLLMGCATTELTSPCPNYGKGCATAPINHWDDTVFSNE